MLATAIVAALVFAQQPTGTSQPPVTLLDAKLGGACSGDFAVKDADGKPVYAASVHVRVRYGFWNVKRADLEVGTNSDGRARLDHLPNKARPLQYEIKKNGKSASVEQDLMENCHGTFDVVLK